jgi:hypothetical protein
MFDPTKSSCVLLLTADERRLQSGVRFVVDIRKGDAVVVNHDNRPAYSSLYYLQCFRPSRFLFVRNSDTLVILHHDESSSCD